jgi:predicted transporter
MAGSQAFGADANAGARRFGKAGFSLALAALAAAGAMVCRGLGLELRSLIMGLLVAVLAFAVKSGLGWAYLWQRRGRGHRLWPTFGALGLYAAVFGLTLFLVKRIDLLANYGAIEPLWRGGQTIHWLIAILLFSWGLILMRHGDPVGEGCDPACGGGKGRPGSGAFLALIIPCPVCLSVVTMSLACLALYFPGQALAGAAILYAGFVAVAGAAGLSLVYGLLGPGENLERSLGLAMTAIAAYFMISALVLPQFGQIDRVYRLASYAGERGKGLPVGGAWLAAAIAALVFLGFLMGRRKAGRPGVG